MSEEDSDPTTAQKTGTAKRKPKASLGGGLVWLGLSIAVLAFTLKCLGPSNAYFALLIAGIAGICEGIRQLAASAAGCNPRTDVDTSPKAKPEADKDR